VQEAGCGSLLPIFGEMARKLGLGIGWVVAVTSMIVSGAQAACTAPVAGRLGPVRLVAAVEGVVSITFLGHASFLIESPERVRIVTDYNDAIPAPVTPDIVTMNNAHPTHYTDSVEPGVKYILRGWDPAGGVATHRLEYRDVRIHNVPTNVREFGGTRYNGNSIFVFDIADLCIAHLGHLHHTLTQTHLAELGAIDVVMVPVDGAWTLNQEDMIEVLQQIKPKIIIPMHIFTRASLDKFLTRIDGLYLVRQVASRTIVLTRSQLPERAEVLVLPGG
jgi:L-ascorbate metabolism protein UlaG (beta-lactamase superfamily)